jgi:hypothetical protein
LHDERGIQPEDVPVIRNPEITKNADVAARYRYGKGVEMQNQHHGDGAETIDIGSVLRGGKDNSKGIEVATI